MIPARIMVLGQAQVMLNGTMRDILRVRFNVGYATGSYEIMKGIMAKESSGHEQNVPSFEYNPADRRYPKLFDFTRNFEDLEDMLLNEYAGKSLSMQEIYENHNVGKPYIKTNYKDMLKKLEDENKIIANPPKTKRRKGTFADNVKVTFLRKEVM